MSSKDLAKLAIAGLDEKKAQDIKIIDISEVSVMADYFIIASGTNRNQVQAMADNVEEKLHKEGVNPRQIEGCAVSLCNNVLKKPWRFLWIKSWKP